MKLMKNEHQIFGCYHNKSQQHIFHLIAFMLENASHQEKHEHNIKKEKINRLSNCIN